MTPATAPDGAFVSALAHLDEILELVRAEAPMAAALLEERLGYLRDCIITWRLVLDDYDREDAARLEREFPEELMG